MICNKFKIERFLLPYYIDQIFIWPYIFLFLNRLTLMVDHDSKLDRRTKAEGKM